MLREAADRLRDGMPRVGEGPSPDRPAAEGRSRWRADPTGGIVRQPDPNRPGRPGPGLNRYQNELSPAAAIAVWALLILLLGTALVVGLVTRSVDWASLPLTLLPVVVGAVLVAKRR